MQLLIFEVCVSHHLFVIQLTRSKLSQLFYVNSHSRYCLSPLGVTIVSQVQFWNTSVRKYIDR